MHYFELTLVIDLCFVLFFIGPKHIPSTQNGTLSISADWSISTLPFSSMPEDSAIGGWRSSITSQILQYIREHPARLTTSATFGEIFWLRRESLLLWRVFNISHTFYLENLVLVRDKYVLKLYFQWVHKIISCRYLKIKRSKAYVIPSVADIKWSAIISRDVRERGKSIFRRAGAAGPA